MQFTFLIPESSDFFDYGTPDEAADGTYVLHVAKDAREWLEERVGPIDPYIFEYIIPRREIASGHWDVVHPSVSEDWLRSSIFDHLLVRMDTDELTAVEFKLRWG